VPFKMAPFRASFFFIWTVYEMALFWTKHAISDKTRRFI
jgi:hypothetical protein